MTTQEQFYQINSQLCKIVGFTINDKKYTFTLTDKMIYSCLVSFIKRYGNAQPSQVWLAESFGLTIRTVRTSLKKLEDLKLITKSTKVGSGLSHYEYGVVDFNFLLPYAEYVDLSKELKSSKKQRTMDDVCY